MQFLDKLFGKPSLADFAREFIRSLQDAGQSDELRFDAGEGRIIRLRDGEVVQVINLANMYRSYLAQPRAKRPDYLGVCVRGALTSGKVLPDEFDDARPDLRPRLWARSTLEQMRIRGLRDGRPANPSSMPSEPIGEHLLACLAYDWPKAVQSVSQEDLQGWGVTYYEAMEAAKQNLEETTSAYAQLGENLYVFSSGDSYDATRLLLVERINDLEVAGKTVAMAPNRDSLLITGSEDPVGLQLMADLATKGLAESYALRGSPLILDDGEWVDWMPPDGNPLRPRFREMELNWIGSEYAAQKELLEAVHQKQGIDLCVASFSAVQKPGGERVSYCIWGKGVDSLLPVTHKVAFMQLGRQGLAVFGDWNRVMEAAGDLMELTDHYPRRYRVREFPDKAVLDAIGLSEI